MVDIFTTLFATLQAALDTYVHSAVSNAVDYVDGPIKIMATLTVMGVGSLYILGMTKDPVIEFVKTGAIIAVVFSLAGSVGLYNEYLGNFLHGLPADLMGVFASGEAPSSEGGFGEAMDGFTQQVMGGLDTIYHAGSGWSRIGFVMLALVLFVVMLWFSIAACAAMGIAMVGSSLVVGIGPIMILGLLLPQTREFFTRWFSYGIQFAVLAAFVGSVLGLMSSVLDQSLVVFENQAESISFTALAAPAVIMGICAYIFGQLPSMASSVTGGIGLSIGNAAWRGASAVTKEVMWHSGGKQVAAHGQADQRIRTQKSITAAERRADWMRQKWEGVTNPPTVSGR